jgi:predicted GIY-YIG superfamily endonuclease
MSIFDEVDWTVYLLMRDGVCVYVGATKDFRSRLYSHTHMGGKEFDSVEVIECDTMEDMVTTELALLAQERPLYNDKVERRWYGPSGVR